MSLETQRDSYTCGAECIRYALSLHGIGFKSGEALSTEDIKRVIPNGWSGWFRGYDETRLASAARRLGLATQHHHFSEVDEARYLANLRAACARGSLCMVGVHDEDSGNFFHWMLVAGFSKDGKWAYVLDPSAFDVGLTGRVYAEVADDDEFEYSGNYALSWMAVSRLSAWTSPCSPEEMEDDEDRQFFLELSVSDTRRFIGGGGLTDKLMLAMNKHQPLVAFFDEYVDDLKGIFNPPGAGQSASDFVDGIRGQLIETAGKWMAGPNARTYLENEVDGIIAMLDAYPMTVTPQQAPRALLELAFLLGYRGAEYAYDAGPRFDYE